MGLEASWSLADIPSNARDAAKAAALREGLSVGEWLTRRILKRFSEMSTREQEEAFNDLANRIGELNDRLDQFENKSRVEPLREAVKKLHQGMARLSDDLVQTAGRSAIELSTLAGTVERMNGAVEQVRANANESQGAFDRHIAELQAGARTIDQRNGEAAREIASQMVDIAQSLEDLRARLFKSISSSERGIAHAEQGLHDLDVRSNDALQALTTGLEILSATVEESRNDTTATSTSLDGRIHSLQVALDDFDSRQADHSRLVTGKYETLGNNFAELRDDTAEMCGALDRRLLLVQQALQGLDSRQSGADALAGNLESLTHRVENVWTRMSSARASIEERLAHAERSISELNQSNNDGLRKLDKAESLEEIFTAAIAGLENGLAELKMRFTDSAADDRLAAVEHTLSELANRTASAEASLNDLQPQTGAIGTELRALGERLDREARKQAEVVAEVRKGLLDETGALVGHAVKSAAQQQQSIIADLRKGLLDETGTLVGQAIEASAQKQQSAIAEIRIGVLDEALRTVSDKFEAELRMQKEMFAEWRAHVLEEAVEAIGAKLESQGRIQQDAMDELKASLLNLSRTLSERLETTERKQDETMAELRAELAAVAVPVQPAAAMLQTSDESAHVEDIASGSAPGNSVSETVGASDHVVLEPDAPARVETPHEDGAQVGSEDSRFPIPEAAQSEHLPSDHEVVAESLQPAFARDDAQKQPPDCGTYLSAARQSLQAAAARSDNETSSKELFGVRFFRPDEGLAKANGQTTSYALLAGIVLVAILSVMIAVSQFMGRSAPAPDVSRPAPTLMSTHPLMPKKTAARPSKHLAIQRPLSVAAMQSDPDRLAMLANMGNAQAQLLLGVHDLGANDAEAAKWLAQAAAQGDAEAQYRLGSLYAGGRGVKADPAMALRWYQTAANAGYRKAMFGVALAYAQGQGTAKNPQQAAHWFEKAAQLGLVDAQFDLAVLYERGLGVQQSLTDAYRWYTIAARAGDRESRDRIEALTSQLSPDDRKSAEAAAAEFKPPTNTAENKAQ